ncbi:MAG: hypothetical protein QOJ51_4559 [Acidobacteriaceae bacterium]|jgi:hypothetical protein|nr:hypothetical protein [Acidobacteriaceae bacterium]
MFVTLGASVAALSLRVSLRVELFPLVTLLLAIWALALIVSSHYLRKTKNKREQRRNPSSGPEDASEG